MMKVMLTSGFQSRSDLFRLQLAGTAPAAALVDSAASCTWHDDPDSTHEVEVDGPAMLVRTIFSSHGAVQSRTIEFLGISDAELSAEIPQPAGGGVWYWTRCYAGDDIKPIPVSSVGEYLAALGWGATPKEFGAPSWVEMPYEAGCQAAACFWRIGAAGLETEEGCGDNAPYLTEAGEIRYPSDDQADFESACEAITRRMEAEQGAWLRESYARGQNPLPGLRKSSGGRWEYRRLGAGGDYPAEPHGELVLPNGDSVIWIPAN